MEATLGVRQVRPPGEKRASLKYQHGRQSQHESHAGDIGSCGEEDARCGADPHRIVAASMAPAHRIDLRPCRHRSCEQDDEAKDHPPIVAASTGAPPHRHARDRARQQTIHCAKGQLLPDQLAHGMIVQVPKRQGKMIARLRA